MQYYELFSFLQFLYYKSVTQTNIINFTLEKEGKREKVMLLAWCDVLLEGRVVMGRWEVSPRIKDALAEAGKWSHVNAVVSP